MMLPEISSNHWFVFATLKEIKSGITKRKFFGKNYFSFISDQDNIQIILDNCPHRGYPLSIGKFEKDSIQCSYHGWKFNSVGECIEVPGVNPCPKFKLTSIASKVVDDLVWCSLDSASSFPQFNIMNNSYSFHCDFKIGANPFLIIENTFDRMHVPFIHRGFSTKAQKKVTYHLALKKNRLDITNLDEGKQVGLLSKLLGSKDDIAIERYIHPGILQIEFQRKGETKLLFTSFLTPASNNQTNVAVRVEFQKKYWGFEILLAQILKWFTVKITNQDIRCMEIQQKNLETNKQNFTNTSQDYTYNYLKKIIDSDGNTGDEEKTIELNLP